MKTKLIVLGLSCFAMSAEAESSRSLGSFALKVSPAPWQPRANQMDIGAPGAGLVYADFTYTASRDSTLSFSPGSNGSFSCNMNNLDMFFDITCTDPANPDQSTRVRYESYPRNVYFPAHAQCSIRFSITNFPDPCVSLNTSFLTFPAN